MKRAKPLTVPETPYLGPPTLYGGRGPCQTTFLDRKMIFSYDDISMTSNQIIMFNSSFDRHYYSIS